MVRPIVFHGLSIRWLFVKRTSRTRQTFHLVCEVNETDQFSGVLSATIARRRWPAARTVGVSEPPENFCVFLVSHMLHIILQEAPVAL